ncbi:hypothetical protein [uncultured Devosia sp.]|uniref:hypothetical protein n=1 Tax=uncultured Devosia sp. TaxID=211434 RepID=UPI00262DBAC2|nr:hypothetical protein [uncultured Devosia sp.]
MEELSRTEQLGKARAELERRFPSATFHTNDDANPSTPMSVRAEWGNGRVKKVVRANSPRDTVDQFVSKVTAVLAPFEKLNVPSKHLTV